MIPEYICVSCAEKRGGKRRELWSFSTWHNGKCEICDQDEIVAHRRDWIWPENDQKNK